VFRIVIEDRNRSDAPVKSSNIESEYSENRIVPRLMAPDTTRDTAVRAPFFANDDAGSIPLARNKYIRKFEIKK
jgi:hypothetical protein